MRQLFGKNSVLWAPPIFAGFAFIGVFARALSDDQSAAVAAVYGMGAVGILALVFVVVELFRTFGR